MIQGIEHVVGVVSGWDRDRDKLSGQDEIAGFCRLSKWEAVELLIRNGAPIRKDENGRWESSKVGIFLWRIGRLGLCPNAVGQGYAAMEAAEGAVVAKKRGGNGGGEGR